jgi:hypothetical protein
MLAPSCVLLQTTKADDGPMDYGIFWQGLPHEASIDELRVCMMILSLSADVWMTELHCNIDAGETRAERKNLRGRALGAFQKRGLGGWSRCFRGQLARWLAVRGLVLLLPVSLTRQHYPCCSGLGAGGLINCRGGVSEVAPSNNCDGPWPPPLGD